MQQLWINLGFLGIPERGHTVALTWNQFKVEVERIMERDGISKDTEIDYIDITSPEPEPEGDGSGYHSIFVSNEPDGYLSISG